MKDTILIIDDEIINIKFLQTILKSKYKIATANNGITALKMLDHMTPDLILLDLYMPMMDGFDILKQLKSNSKTSEIPVIILTAQQDESVELKALEAGAIDFVSRPFQPQIILNKVLNALQITHYQNQLENMVEEQAKQIVSQGEQINKLQKEVIISVANLMEQRDGSTGSHAKRTGLYVESLVKALQKANIYADILSTKYAENLCNSAYLHDIGKIQIKDSILLKEDQLDESEYEKMKLHAPLGGKIIRNIFNKIEDESFIEIAAEVATYHHERWDGSGYPEGLKGTCIPLSARIMAVADVFDALASKRCYKDAIDLDETFSMMEKMSGTYFDPEIIHVFLENKVEIKRIAFAYQEN